MQDATPPPPLLPEIAEPAPPRPVATAGGSSGEWLALLRNRLIIAGLSLIALLVVAAAVLVVIGNGDDEEQLRAGNIQPTPLGGAAAPTGEDLSGVLRTTASMRNGPGVEYPAIGTIPQGTAVAVVGRNADDSWVQVVYPPGFDVLGWVNLAFIDVEGDISALVIAGPGESPNVSVPTSSGPPPATEQPSLPEPTGSPTRRPTNTRVPTITPRPSATATLPPLFQQPQAQTDATRP
jgi:uncharacterized protein YraI